MPGSRDYRVVSREQSDEYRDPESRCVVRVGAAEFGGASPVVIAGPCAVESEEQTIEIACAVRDAGAQMLRGGAFKPRTSPYDFQGLGRRGLEILALAREVTGLPVVTELMDTRLADLVGRYADMIQIGSRNMQNYPLLTEAGRLGKPVLLKRGMAATLHEWLCAAEYIAKEGNTRIVLCERGIRAFGNGEYSRFTLDLNVIRAAQRATYLPIIVDPSHATGYADMVLPASEAALSYGAQGLIIEVMREEVGRDCVLCDARQAIRPSELCELMTRLNRIYPHFSEHGAHGPEREQRQPVPMASGLE